MRQGFFNFLIAVHLKTHFDARLSTSKEYILPLVRQLEGRNVFDPSSENRYPQLLGPVVSILPVMQAEKIRRDVMGGKLGKTVPNGEVTAAGQRLLPPAINFGQLKEEVMHSLMVATHNAVMSCRDFIGGDSLNHFEPLLKIFDTLFVIGLMTDADVVEILKLLHPTAFDEQFSPLAHSKSRGKPAAGDPASKKIVVCKGLPEIELAERVKIQLVNILEHLCDVQLRHRIESLISFSASFVRDLQKDQCRRYMEIKQTDMPPAEAARRTKEFRCPPKEQMVRSFVAFEHFWYWHF